MVRLNKILGPRTHNLDTPFLKDLSDEPHGNSILAADEEVSLESPAIHPKVCLNPFVLEPCKATESQHQMLLWYSDANE